jgi:hypothetical protein
MDQLSALSRRQIDGIPLPRFALRLAWAAFKFLAVVYFANVGTKFFYQGF